jgi:hypothetical protein
VNLSGERLFMQQPKGVLAITSLFALAAAYLWTIAAILLIAPGAISLMAGKYFAYGLEIAGPYMILLVGSCYVVIAWGLFRLQNWARWSAMLVIAFSIVPLVPKISMAALGLPILWYGLQIAMRVAAAWYLAQAPSVLDAFAGKQVSLHHGDTESPKNLT